MYSDSTLANLYATSGRNTALPGCAFSGENEKRQCRVTSQNHILVVRGGQIRDNVGTVIRGRGKTLRHEEINETTFFVVGSGELGIGNTASAAILMSYLCMSSLSLI